MTGPARVQLRRLRHWRLPPNTVSVARPTNWGNRFVVRPDLPVEAPIGSLYVAVGTAEQAVASYRQYLIDHPAIAKAAMLDLRGKNLACWCPLDEPCHADVLLEVANQPLALRQGRS